MRPGQYWDGRIKISSISHLLPLRNSGEQRCAGLCWKFVSRELSTSRERCSQWALNRTDLERVLHKSDKSGNMGKDQTLHRYTDTLISAHPQRLGWEGGIFAFIMEI